MSKIGSRWVAGVAFVAIAFSQAALAQTKAPDEPSPAATSGVDTAAPEPFAGTVCEHPADAAREAADQRIVDETIRASNSGGYAALATHLDALRDVLAHAPSCYPEVERRGDDVIVRSDADSSAILALTVVAAGQHRNTRVVRGPNPYGNASLLLGAYSNEMRNFEDAIAWLDRGLALQPREQHLVLEKATALGQLRRFDEQVALLQAELNDPWASLSLDTARFQRNLGIALIDLNRLDEAEAALREAIRLQPDNPRAENELRYLAQLRAGGQRTTASMGHVGEDAPPAPRQ